MSQVTTGAALLIFITLTRGLGQTALSIVSLAMVGKWFQRRLTWAMGIYALAMSIGFMIAFPVVGAVVLATRLAGGVGGDWHRLAAAVCAARMAAGAIDA